MKSLQRKKVNPIISIICATYNEESNITKTLDSLYHQNFKNFELIIIDNNSTDATIRIVNSYKKKLNIIIISEMDTGIYSAWNKGINLANGKYLAFLGAGDIYVNNDSLFQLASKINDDEYDFIHSKISNGSHIYGEKFDFNKFKYRMNISHSGMLHSLKFIRRNGFFNENYKIASDYEFFLRNKEKLNDFFINRQLVRMLPGGISTKSIKIFFEVYSIKKNLNTLSSFQNFFLLIISIITFIKRRLKNL